MANEEMEINLMIRVITAMYFAMTFLPAASADAEPAGSCRTGKLVDVQIETRVIDAGTAERGEEKAIRNGGRSYTASSIRLTQQQTIYTVIVQFDATIYSAQSESVFGLGFKPTSLVINDPIHGCIRGNNLALIRPDGKEYKARIVRVVRDLQSRREEQ